MLKERFLGLFGPLWAKISAFCGRLLKPICGKLFPIYTKAQEKVGGRSNLAALSFAGFFVLLIVALAAWQSSKEASEVMAPAAAEPMTARLEASSVGGAHLSVTLIFSEPVNLESLKENVTIRPGADVTFTQINDYRVRIRPVEGWSSGSHTYLTIGTQYQSQNGHSFDRPQELRFYAGRQTSAGRTATQEQEEEEDGPLARYWGSGESYVLDVSADMSINFQSRLLKESIPVAVETYRLPSIERLQRQGDIFLNHNAPLSLLERVDANVFLLENGDSFFSIPHHGEGGYIVAVSYTDPVTGEESHHRTSYLITSLSVYMQSTVRDTLVWVHSTRTGQAMPGLRIHFGESNQPAAITDQNGMVMLSRDLEDQESRFRIYSPGGEMVYFDNGVSQLSHGMRERFYSYLFLDRTIYRPEDTINFWGVVQPFRNNEQPMPETVRITFDAGGLNLVQDLPIGPGGVFSGEVALERVRSAQYSLQASLHFPSIPGEEEEEEEDTHLVFEVRYFSVRDFQKPAYTISSEVDSNFYTPGDAVTVSAHVSFFDGTPLPNSAVEVSYYNYARREWVELGDVQTDADGDLAFSFPAWVPGSGVVSDHLIINNYRLRIADDGEDITHIGSYRIFPTDVLIDAHMQRSPDGENISLTVETFMADFKSQALQDEIAANDDLYWWLDNRRMLEIAKGEPVDIQDIQIAFSWDFVDRGGDRIRHNPAHWSGWLFDSAYHYGYIIEANPSLSARQVTDSATKEQLLSVDTQGGSVTLNGIVFLGDRAIDWEERAFARATVRFRDTKGNSRVDWGYYPGASSFREDWNSYEDQVVEGYSLAARNLTQGTDIPAHFGQRHFFMMDIGDVVRFDVLQDSEPVGQGGRILYSIIQDGVFSHRLVTGNSFDFQYRMEHGASVNLVAVYFDGKETHSLTRTVINANTASYTLNVEVTPDREQYAPGDTVRLQVRTTDSSGNAIPASVCLAVVDEAVFAVSEQYIFLLEEYYADVRYTNNQVQQYFTTYRREPAGRYRDGGKAGNENLSFTDDSFRSNFKDTAAFLPATTNAAGLAHLSFVLPDNNTSWRITSVAVSGNRMGGQSRDNIISTLPFFVRPVVNTKYIEGDDIAMLVQGQGALLDPQGEVSFQVSLTGDSFDQTFTFSGEARRSHPLSFGQLPSGMYTAVFRAQQGSYTDAVELPISVVRSNLELVVNRPLDLSQPLEVDASRFPVTITFYDQTAQPFMTSINSLLGHYCMATNQRMSRVVAKQALADSMPGLVIPHYLAQTDENIADMQNADGGIGTYLGGASDLRVTVYVLLAAQDDQFNRRAMAEYFRGMLERIEGSDAMLAALCHLGLAYLGDEAMTAEFLQDRLEEATRVEPRAYYIAALAAIGETEKALAFYDRHLARRAIADNRDTAAIWVAATLAGHSAADDIAVFFGGHTWRISTLYEAMIYVRHFDRAVETSTLRYSLGDSPHSIEFGLPSLEPHWLNRSSRFMSTIALSRSELESLRFTDIPESVRATIYYIGAPSELGLNPSEKMTIDQSIQPIGDQAFEVTLSVRLGEDAPLGQYDISAWIPSNTRLYDHDRHYEVSRGNEITFRTRQEMQNLYISFNNRSQGAQTIIYTYRVRQTFESQAVLDTAYIIHGDTGENANSARGVFSTSAG